MAYSPLRNAIISLKTYGFFDVILPMLLVFLVFYAILHRTKILGDPDKGFVRAINALVSLIIAFMFIVETSLIDKMYALIPRTALLLVIFMLVLLILAFVGVYKVDSFSDLGWKNWLIALPLILVFLGVLDASGMYVPIIHQAMVYFAGGSGMSVNITKETLNIAIAVLVSATVLGLIIYIVSAKD